MMSDPDMNQRILKADGLYYSPNGGGRGYRQPVRRCGGRKTWPDASDVQVGMRVLWDQSRDGAVDPIMATVTAVFPGTNRIQVVADASPLRKIVSAGEARLTSRARITIVAKP